MAESVRDNRLIWGLAALGVLLVLALLWIWSIGNGLAQADQRGQQLEARFADFASGDSVADLQQKQAELETRLAALQVPDLGPTQQQLDGLRSDLGTLQDELSRLAEAGVGDLATRLAAVEAAVSDAGPVDLATLPGTLEALRTDLGALQAQLGSFAPARVDDLSGALDALTTRVAAIDGTGLPQLATDVGALDTRVDDVEVKLADVVVPDLGPLELRLGTVAADLETLRTDVAAAATVTQIGTLETQLAALDTRTGEAASGVADIRGATAQLSSEIGRLDAVLAGKAESAEVVALSDQLDGIRERVANLPAPDTAAFEADVATLRRDLDAITGRVASLASAEEVAALRSDLAALADKPSQTRTPQVLERIYFASSGTGVADAERPKIEALAQKLAAAPGSVALVGFSDSKGPAELNRSLSLRRAAAVRLALLEAGVDPAAVTSVVGLGEDAPPIPVGDNVAEAGNRVVLVYGH